MKYFYYYPDDKRLISRDDAVDKGILVILGENRKDNDLLVKELDGEDMWFHVANHPSGHAVYTGTNICNDAILRVASLVKEQSKMKNVRRININYIKLRYVRSTKTLGQVTLTKTPKIIKI